MKVIEEDSLTILESSYDKSLLFINVFTLALILIMGVLTLLFLPPDSGNGMYIGLAIILPIALCGFLLSNKQILIIDKTSDALTLEHRNIYGFRYSTKAASVSQIDKLVTDINVANAVSVGIGTSTGTTAISFSFYLEDGSEISFTTYQPDYIVKPKFWSRGSHGPLMKNQEQDVIAPRIAKELGIPIETLIGGKPRDEIVVL